ALYYSVVPAAAVDDKNDVLKRDDEDEKETLPETAYVTGAFKSAWKALNIDPVKRFTALSRRLFIQFLMKLPMRLLSTLGNLPILRAFKGPLTLLFGLSAADKDEEKDGSGSSVETPPTRDELDIPSIADLYSAGVKFVPTDGDLTTIRFDQTTANLYLPKLKLDVNTEVILRNLGAFEAAAAPGALIFTRYTDFMNGMIDTEEDVRLLRKSGIINNHLENDGKVASLWNGMGKCVKLSKVKYLDEVIADVNKHYNRRWNVAVTQY
ncbi:hypothetical protein KI387_010273, partial [Taxus chinensis]